MFEMNGKLVIITRNDAIRVFMQQTGLPVVDAESWIDDAIQQLEDDDDEQPTMADVYATAYDMWCQVATSEDGDKEFYSDY